MRTYISYVYRQTDRQTCIHKLCVHNEEQVCMCIRVVCALGDCVSCVLDRFTSISPAQEVQAA